MKLHDTIVLIIITLFSTAANSIERINVSSGGSESQTNTAVNAPLSADGRFVAFVSNDSTLTATDTNNRDDVFLRDRKTGETQIISVSTSGEQGNDASGMNFTSAISINSTGRYVGFVSQATNLVDDPLNGVFQYYLRDRVDGVTDIVSISSTGETGDQSTFNFNSFNTAEYISISRSGRYIAYASDATNLVAVDTNNASDIFVHDRTTRQTQLVSMSTSGVQGNGGSFNPSISGDGRYIVFSSDSTNIVAYDANNAPDIFLHDRTTGITKLVSKSSDGNIGNSGSYKPMLSGDGKFIVFESASTNFDIDGSSTAIELFVHDRINVTTELVSIAENGEPITTSISSPSISRNGRYITFISNQNDTLVNGIKDFGSVFVRDRKTKNTRLVNHSYAGELGNAGSAYEPSISANGRYITYSSTATNLVRNDTNSLEDIFISRNPFAKINTIGNPGVDQANDSGVFVWRNQYGRYFVKFVAGHSNQNSQDTVISGSVVSTQPLHSIRTNHLEIGVPQDKLEQIGNKRLDFELSVRKPGQDTFSFKTNTQKPLCILLENSDIGLYLGSSKVPALQKFDINSSRSGCGIRHIPKAGSPKLDASIDKGIFLWKKGPGNQWQVKVLAGAGYIYAPLKLTSEENLTNFLPVSIESSDIVNIFPKMIELKFKIFPTNHDGFKVNIEDNSNSCLKSDVYEVPVYLGPLRVLKYASVNLDTGKFCM